MQDMTRTLRYLFIVLLVSLAGTAFAQSGEIKGVVVDETNNPVIGVVVQAIQGGIAKAGAATEEDGSYSIKPITAGRYEIKVVYTSYKTSITSNVMVSPDKTTGVNIKLELDAQKLGEVVVVEYKVPLVDIYNPGGKSIIASEQIEKMPTRTTEGVASNAPGVYSGDGNGLKIAGARTDGTLYIIDGMQVRGRSAGVNVSQNSIDQIEVMTSGLSAKYGDAIGGVVNITTKGVSDKYRGNVLLEHSIEGYNHNLANVGISGPLYSKKLEDGTKKPIIGFRIGVDAIYDSDPRPTYGGNYVVKEEVLKQLEQTPLTVYPSQNGTPVYRYSSEYLRMDDLELQKRRVSAEEYRGVANGKIDFQIADNLNLTAGGMYNYSRQRAYQQSNSLMAPGAIPLDTRGTARGYLRLTQRFGKNAMADSSGKKPLISNAFYTLQADYQVENFKREHPDHKQDFFKYGYLGKFNTDYATTYVTAADDSTGLIAVKFNTDRQAVRTTFERAELNPILANYTSQYYNSTGVLPATLNDIRGANALINGDVPKSTYGLWNSPGNSLTGYQYTQNDQVAVSIDASFDFQPKKTRHAIQFGLYYQQRVERFFGNRAAGTDAGIWQYMRQLTNTHIQDDRTNPVYLVNGQRYTIEDFRNGVFSLSPSDTVLFNKVSIDTAQSTFDRNLRAKLGLGATDYINVDGLDPSTFSLDMFSADELLNNGNGYVNYYGYDYTGQKQKGQVNFNDFFTKKDANGNFTRDIGAFRPNYIAGYLLDQFQFKDLNFNVGVRIDRYDANTKVLKDPYSIYEVRKLGDARNIAINSINGSHPGNIGDDYVVYVASNESPNPSVIGYRDGDDWYDPYGRYIEDPAVLKQYSGGRDPQPFLVNRNDNIANENFDPNSSFTDYKPQVNVMPRISFSFPISQKALFYAHYDVLVQRPRSENYATAADYFFLSTNNNLILNNPDLKPEKMFDYEVGFQQQLSQRSALTVSGFYKERKDMIQIRPYLYAIPKTYYTYGNRDFSTTKGLILKYDLRRTNHLLMNVSYTLQFAEGSGSGTASGNGGDANFFSNSGILANFIQASLPNLRYSTALDYDSRHMIVANLDYRYNDGEGPMIGNSHFLENAGVNLIFSTRSGEPYTRYALPASRIVSGQINGARYPWHYNIDLRVDKDIDLRFGKKQPEGAKPKDPLVLNAYVMINNVLNYRDVLRVNGYTGRPDEDGYITAPQGIQATAVTTNSSSYIDLYSISNGGGNQYLPSNIGMPRRINIGLQLNF
jgi:hypothetical protein